MTVPGGSHATEYLFHKGLFDPIIERNLLKDQKKKKDTQSILTIM
jgi:acetyl-CoA carboxylase beta subunit